MCCILDFRSSVLNFNSNFVFVRILFIVCSDHYLDLIFIFNFFVIVFLLFISSQQYYEVDHLVSKYSNIGDGTELSLSTVQMLSQVRTCDLEVLFLIIDFL